MDEDEDEHDAPHRQIAHAAWLSGSLSPSTPSGSGASSPSCTPALPLESAPRPAAPPPPDGRDLARRRQRRQSWRRGGARGAGEGDGEEEGAAGEGEDAEGSGRVGAADEESGAALGGEGSSGMMPLRTRRCVSQNVQPHRHRLAEGELEWRRECGVTHMKTRCGRLAMSSFLSGPTSFFFWPKPNQRAPICTTGRSSA